MFAVLSCLVLVAVLALAAWPAAAEWATAEPFRELQRRPLGPAHRRVGPARPAAFAAWLNYRLGR